MGSIQERGVRIAIDVSKCPEGSTSFMLAIS